MQRTMLIAGLAAIVLVPCAVAQPKPNEMYVIVKGRCFEVDEAFHKKVANAKWRSKAELEELESKPVDKTLFEPLAKLKPILTGKEINIEPGKTGQLLSATKSVAFLAAPDQLRLGNKRPQRFDEGFTLNAIVHVSPDRRYVHAKFMENSMEIEGVEKLKIIVDDKGAEGFAEVVSPREAGTTLSRYIPDGGTMLLALQSRPPAVRAKDRWLVAEVTPRIYIEEEERIRRGKSNH